MIAEVDPGVKIGELKEYLCSLSPEELDINTVYLVANGHGLLDDVATLEEYGIEDGTVVEVFSIFLN